MLPVPNRLCSMHLGRQLYTHSVPSADTKAQQMSSIQRSILILQTLRWCTFMVVKWRARCARVATCPVTPPHALHMQGLAAQQALGWKSQCVNAAICCFRNIRCSAVCLDLARRTGTLVDLNATTSGEHVGGNSLHGRHSNRGFGCCF